MPQSKEVHKEYMRTRRGSQKVHNDEGSQDKTVNPCEPVKTITHGTKTIYVTAEKAAKLLMVCQALDRQVSGLQGKENLLDVVRYGCFGPTMAGVKESLGG